MDCGNEQRGAIKFCFKAGLYATETRVLVQKAYRNEVLNRSNVCRQYSRFREGKVLMEDDERGGCPKSTRSEVNNATVVDLFKNDRGIASRMIAETLNISKTVVRRILKEDLGRNMRARFVPHSLTPEQRKYIVTSCQDIIAMAETDKMFLTKLLPDMTSGVLPMNPKQSDRFLNGLVRYPLGRKN